ncbi:TetR/AcrR family transcriptional regulator [Rhodococcoides kyotonense]|uniref:Regulatory protein, tetR family n=1 Tax=Rhodococcoides kyotonense TaxID=398843 RepID=A0A239MSX9_9NOCA|nr:TetR/AcrR family transcriptional regulator [Rhodococcus kyotonensis]SNT44959.1 regulatory protein, tetR family [Rhodococcus kyotonensis]
MTTKGSGRSSARTQPAKPALSRAAIVEATLALIDENGLAAVSMRKVATRLDTAAASLYVYVDDRKDLFEAAYDLALAEVLTSTAVEGPWREQLQRIVFDQIEVLASHNDIALVALADAQIGSNSLRVTERILSLLRSGGVADDACIAAADLLDQFVTSSAIEQAAWSRDALSARAKDPTSASGEAMITSAAGRIEAAYDAVSADDFPAITALKPHLTSADPADRRAWKFNAVLDGVTAASRST